MKKDDLELEDELLPEYDLKSLRVRKLGSGRKSFSFGSQGIAGTPVPIDTERQNDRHSPESWHKTLRDTIKSDLVAAYRTHRSEF
jgi:hypothetical protein